MPLKIEHQHIKSFIADANPWISYGRVVY